MACKKLQQCLYQDGVPFRILRHREQVCTAQQVAAAVHVPGKRFAKVVMVVADSDLVMLVIPATRRVVFDRQLNQLLRAKKVRLAEEREFSARFGECRYNCEQGAMCPFGCFYGFKVFLDSALAKVPEIAFRAGTHRDVICLVTSDYLSLVEPQVAELSVSARPKRLKKHKKKSWWRRLLGL